jgi:hypothetical protein
VRSSSTLLGFLLFASPVAAAGIEYTPPSVPAPPDPASILVRLVGLVAITFAICGGLIWLMRRSTRVAVGPTNRRLVLEGSLTLNGRSSVHILKADGQSVAVTTDATGIRSIVILSEPFEELLNDAA